MDCILVVNVGSATLKFAIFKADKKLTKICSGHINNKKHILSIFDKEKGIRSLKINRNVNLSEPEKFIQFISIHYPNINIKTIGHRIVHGGQRFLGPSLITKSVLKQLKALIPLAPLHMPKEIAFIEKTMKTFPEISQIACFDTSFHRTLPRIATLFAIPQKYTKEGIIRYGFHGLSYEYIMTELSSHITNLKSKKIIIAHLGNGASMCAIYKNQSIATSMGFTALDGLVMGTRCGSIDPGILLYLMEEKGFSVKDINKMLYEKSGLLGTSGITNDVQKLINNKNKRAKEALDLFCYRAVQEIGSLTATLQGLDLLVFTGGIGEHAASIRKNICNQLKWLGLELDSEKNKSNASIITSSKSKIKTYVVPTNEELMIANHVFNLCYKL